MNEGMVLRELFGPVTPYRALPAECKVAQPMRRPHERRAIADGGVSDSDIIRGLAETHRVLGRASVQPLAVGQGGGLLSASFRASAWSGSSNACRKAPVRAAFNSSKTPLRRLKIFLGFARVARGAQQAHQRGLGVFICGFKQAERPRVGQSIIRHIFETRNERHKKPHAQTSHRSTFRGAPALKLLTIREIKALEEIILELRRSLQQRISRENRLRAGQGSARIRRRPQFHVGPIRRFPGRQ